MKKQDVMYLIENKESFDFKYNGHTYNLTYDTNPKTKETIIVFGLLYEEKSYESFKEFWNKARIGNHFVKDVLDTIPFKR